MSRKKKRKQTSKPRPAPSAASAPGAPELRAEPPPATARDERAPDRSALDGAQRVERDEAPASDVLGRRGEGTLLSRMGELGAAHDPAQTWTGILHLALVCAVLLIAGALPYLSHPLGLRLPRLEAWARGDGLPVARLFGPREEGAPVLAAAGQPSGSSVEQLGAAVAQSLAEDDAVLPVPGPAQRVEGRTPAVRIDPSELEDLAREIEDPEGRAMRPFYEALLRTARGDAGAITRVAHYGDSSIAGDGITSTLRRRLQQRFGDAGHGFVLIARGHMPYRHQDIEHEASDNWRLIELVRAGLSDHLYGYGGVQYRSAAGGTARFETSDGTPNGTAVSRFELWFQRHPRGGRVQLRVDGGEWQDLSTQGERVEDAWHSVDVPDGPHRLDLRTAGGGENRLYGMTLDRTGRPGVAYDSLGMVGARARRMLGIDPAHFAAQHEHRGTSLIVLGFGGNDADDRMSAEQWERDYREVLHMVRAARPNTACLLMAPLDQAERDERGNIETMSSVPVIVEAQRRAALAEGCAFFDTFSAMGGDGAMRRWFRTNPRLAFGDFRHATPAGYRVVGTMLYKALLKGFADYLAAHGER